MFCSDCGHNLEGAQGGICPNCDTQTAEASSAASTYEIGQHSTATYVAVNPVAKKKYWLVAAIIAAVAVVAIVAIIVLVNMNRGSIVGSWELVDITGGPDAEFLLEIFDGIVDTFFPDGTGVSHWDGHYDELFTWSTTGNRLRIIWEWADPSVHRFEISGEMLITDNPDTDVIWIWRRIN